MADSHRAAEQERGRCAWYVADRGTGRGMRPGAGPINPDSDELNGHKPMVGFCEVLRQGLASIRFMASGTLGVVLS